MHCSHALHASSSRPSSPLLHARPTGRALTFICQQFNSKTRVGLGLSSRAADKRKPEDVLKVAEALACNPHSTPTLPHLPVSLASLP